MNKIILLPFRNTECIREFKTTRIWFSDGFNCYLIFNFRGVDFGSGAVMAPLFTIYLGTQDSGPAEKYREPAATRQRLKLLQYMCKARGQGLHWPASIRVRLTRCFNVQKHFTFYLFNSSVLFVALYCNNYNLLQKSNSVL